MRRGRRVAVGGSWVEWQAAVDERERGNDVTLFSQLIFRDVPVVTTALWAVIQWVPGNCGKWLHDGVALQPKA